MAKTIEVPEFALRGVENITRRDFLVGGTAALLLAGCGSGGEESESSGETRAVEHALGTTEVPVSPGRVVAVDTFAIDAMIALGTEAAGVRDQATIPRYMAREVEGIESVGDGPNLEAVAALEPDLILTLELTEVYDELSQIAPTVAPAFESSGDWKDVHLKYAEALGMEEDGRSLSATLRRRYPSSGSARNI